VLNVVDIELLMGSLNANGVRCVFIFHFRKTIYLQCTFYYADGVAYYLEKASLLKGSEVKLLQAIKKIRLGQPESLKEYARIQKDIKTEELTLEDIGVHVKELTGEFKSMCYFLTECDTLIWF
jgi:hypothetical protein